MFSKVFSIVSLSCMIIAFTATIGLAFTVSASDKVAESSTERATEKATEETPGSTSDSSQEVDQHLFFAARDGRQ